MTEEAQVRVDDEVGAAAADDAASVVALTERLVRAASRGGLDDYRPAVDVVAGWLSDHGLAARVLGSDVPGSDEEPVAVTCDVTGARPGPHYVLDACLDTAAFGDEDTWRYPPTGAVVDDGWMFGRGASDSKVAVAMFCHIAARLAADPTRFAGTVTLLFDLDEHTGGFGGIRRYLDETDPTAIDGVLIGYPGPDEIVVGGRGFLRVRVILSGRADHSASGDPRPANAVVKAAALVTALSSAPLPADETADFPLPPKLTVTSITGGQSGAYSVVPDRCVVEVDIRLTPTFGADAARALLERAVADVDRGFPSPRPTVVEPATEPWPPFRLPDDHPLPTALRDAARRHGLDPTPVVAGMSNIGNLLAARRIPATAGFGVAHRGLHAADEAIEIASIPAVQATYHRAVLALCAGA